MSTALELLLLAAFFLSYLWKGIYFATAVLMAGSVLVLAATTWRSRRLQPLPLAVTVLVLILGGATLLLRDPLFVQWKFSVVEWLFGLVLLASHLIGRRPLLQRTLGERLSLPDTVWRRLNLMWALFFLFLGCLNVVVIYRFSLTAWVDFKVYGVSALVIAFALLQGFYLSRYLPSEEKGR